MTVYVLTYATGALYQIGMGGGLLAAYASKTLAQDRAKIVGRADRVPIQVRPVTAAREVLRGLGLGVVEQRKAPR